MRLDRWLCGWALALLVGMAWAQAPAPAVQASLQRAEDGLFLTASVVFEPSDAVTEALERSVPLYFVAQADVFRQRWYWTDRRVASASRTYRLAYQPLSRRWRVSVATGQGPSLNLQYALHQNHPSLRQALAAITRLYAWRIADAAALAPGETHHVNFQFKLDMALLPRPFQLGMNAQSDWSLDVRRVLPVPLSTEPTAETAGDRPTPDGAQEAE